MSSSMLANLRNSIETPNDALSRYKEYIEGSVSKLTTAVDLLFSATDLCTEAGKDPLENCYFAMDSTSATLDRLKKLIEDTGDLTITGPDGSVYGLRTAYQEMPVYPFLTSWTLSYITSTKPGDSVIQTENPMLRIELDDTIYRMTWWGPQISSSLVGDETTVSLQDIIDYASDAIGVNNIISDAIDLVESNNFSMVNFSAKVSGYINRLSSNGASMFRMICDSLPESSSAVSLLSLLSALSPREDQISGGESGKMNFEFDTRDYTLSGAIIIGWDKIISLASSAVGALLWFINPIIGAAAYVAGQLASVIVSALQENQGNVPEYHDGWETGSFAPPFFQTRDWVISSATYYQPILNIILKQGICTINTPFFSGHIWFEEDLGVQDDVHKYRLGMELCSSVYFAPSLFQRSIDDPAGPMNATIARYFCATDNLGSEPGPIYDHHLVTLSRVPDMPSPQDVVYRFYNPVLPNVSAYDLMRKVVDNVLYNVGSSIPTINDDDGTIRERIVWGLYLTAQTLLSCYNNTMVYEVEANQSGYCQLRRAPSNFNDAYQNLVSWVGNMGNQEYVATNAITSGAGVFTNDDYLALVKSFSLFLVNEGVLDNFMNLIVATFRTWNLFGSDATWQTIVPSYVISGTQATIIEGTSWLSSWLNINSRPVRTANPAIIPAKYRISLLARIAITLGIVAVVAITGLIATTAIRKRIQAATTLKYAQVNQLLQQYTEDPTYENYKVYSRAVFWYNLRARFLGISTIGLTDGWLQGTSASPASEGAVAKITELFRTNDSSIEEDLQPQFNSIKRLISGE